MADRQALATRLETLLRETLAAFDTHPAALTQPYAPGKWTAHELLVHISDAETVLLDCVCAASSAIPSRCWSPSTRTAGAKELFYSTRDISLARMQFEAARRSMLELAANLPESADEKIGTHPEAGPLTFLTILEKTANHNAHHLEQCRIAVKGQA